MAHNFPRMQYFASDHCSIVTAHYNHAFYFRGRQNPTDVLHLLSQSLRGSDSLREKNTDINETQKNLPYEANSLSDSKKFYAFLPWSQQPATAPYPEPEESNPYPHNLFLDNMSRS
jgi:hypothetical protein